MFVLVILDNVRLRYIISPRPAKEMARSPGPKISLDLQATVTHGYEVAKIRRDSALASLVAQTLGLGNSLSACLNVRIRSPLDPRGSLGARTWVKGLVNDLLSRQRSRFVGSHLALNSLRLSLQAEVR